MATITTPSARLSSLPPAADALALARLVLPSLNVLTPHTIEALG